MKSTVRESEWYLDFGASYHMIGNKEFFSILEDKDHKLHIEFGDDGRYSTKGIGIVTFKWDSGSHLHLKNVMYVPGLMKNLVSVAVLEEKCYDVVFSKGNFFLKNVVTGKVKQIGVRVKNIYKLEVYFSMHATILMGVSWGNV